MKFIKIKNTPRGGAQPNRLIAKISLFIAFAFFGGVFLLQAEPAYAAQPSAKRSFAKTTAGSAVVGNTLGIIQTSDGGWLTYGVSSSAPRITKFNSSGNIEWSATGTLPLGDTVLYYTDAAETQNGSFVLLGENLISEFEEVDGTYQETKHLALPVTDTTNIEYDNNIYNGFSFGQILVDSDGGYLISAQLGYSKRMVIKFNDVPTCELFTPSLTLSGNYDFNDACSDIVWKVIFDGSSDELFYDTPVYQNGNKIIISYQRDGSAVVAELEEAIDGGSVQTNWSAAITLDLQDSRIDYIVSIDDDTFLAYSGTSVFKLAKTEENNTVSLQKVWSYTLPYTKYWQVNDGGFAVKSDGSVYIKTSGSGLNNDTIDTSIPSIANHGGNSVVIKLDEDGQFVYAVRLGQSNAYQREGIVINSDGSFTVMDSQNYELEKYVDSMIYDINYHIEQAEKPAEYQEFATQQTWANTNFTFAKQSYDGWNFNGWYEDQSLIGTRLNKKYITADTDVYGAYTRKSYSAYFYVNTYDDQGNYISTDPTIGSTVIYGDTNYAPEINIPDGYTFSSWYYDRALTQPADLSDPNSILPSSSTSSIKNFYARLIRSTYLVNFNITSSQNPDYYLETPVRVGHGDTVADPNLTDRQGYKFNGWYTDNTLTSAYNFNTTVTGELNLYAEWIDSTLRIDDEGIHYPGNVIDGTAIYDETTHTLTLDNYNGGPIDITNITDNFTIIINGENIIDSSSDYGIHSSAPLTIEGDGTIDLNVSTNDFAVYGCVLKADDNLIINSSTININDSRDWGEGAICAMGDITINDGDINIITNGTGIISQKDKGNIYLNGGQIDIAAKNNGFRVYNGGLIHLNGSKINHMGREIEGSQPCDGGSVTDTDLLKIDKGELNTECRVYADVIVVNGGALNAKNIEADLINQNGGQINLLNVGSDFGEDLAAIQTSFTVINGGAMQIDDTTMGILLFDDYDDEKKVRLAEKASQIGGIMPENAPIEFNGGDTKIYSTLVPIAILGESPVEDLSTQIYLSNNMLKNPEYATLSQAEFMGEGYITAFSDGEGEITLDMSETGITATHAIKAIHIYPKTVPVPSTDGDEENPNTADFKILGLTSAVFIAIMVQGMIIADLYRRLHGYKEEINQQN